MCRSWRWQPLVSIYFVTPPSPPRWRFPEFKQVSRTENTFDSVSELTFIQVIVCVLVPVGELSKFNPNIARLLVAGRSLGREGRQSIIMSKLCACSNVMSWNHVLEEYTLQSLLTS